MSYFGRMKEEVMIREKLSRKKPDISVSITFLIITLVFCICGQPRKDSQKEEQITDWDNMCGSFEKFVNHPCPSETRAFLETLPGDRANKEKGDKDKFFKLMAGWGYNILSNEITLGNRPAIEAAFRLLNILEEESLHNICVDLSRLIRLNPQGFLEFAYEYKDSYYIKNESYPVRFFIPSYDQLWTAQLFELEMRLRALEQINEDKLREVKAACVICLKDEVEKLEAYPQVRSFFSRAPQIRNTGKEVDELDREKAIRAGKAFIEYPSLENAEALRNTIPKTPEIPRTAFSPVDLESDYWILDYEALAGNKYAVEVVCRLLNFRDGIAGIMYEATLGNLIRVNPNLYLQVIKDYRGQPFIFESARGRGIEYNFYEDGIACILEARIQALQGVEDPDLLEIRDACIRYLRGNR